MTNEQIKSAINRIMRGESATVVVAPGNLEAAKKVFAGLSPRLRALLTLKVGQ